MENPTRLAPELARILKFDPVATGQIKEHISTMELIELLGLELSEVSKKDILAYVRDNFERSEIRAATR